MLMVRLDVLTIKQVIESDTASCHKRGSDVTRGMDSTEKTKR